MKKVITLLLAFMLMLSLAACGGGSSTSEIDDALQGKWGYMRLEKKVDINTFYEFDNGEVTRSVFRGLINEPPTIIGKYEITNDSIVLTFDPNIFFEGQPTEEKLEYTYTDGVLKMVFKDGRESYTCFKVG